MKEVSTCREALLRTQTTPFDAVLLDIGLPDRDGLSVLSRLQEIIPFLPVIMLTAATSTDQCVDSVARGAFSYLPEPYNQNELRTVIRQAISVTERAKAPDKTGIH